MQYFQFLTCCIYMEKSWHVQISCYHCLPIRARIQQCLLTPCFFSIFRHSHHKERWMRCDVHQLQNFMKNYFDSLLRVKKLENIWLTQTVAGSCSDMIWRKYVNAPFLHHFCHNRVAKSWENMQERIQYTPPDESNHLLVCKPCERI